jgi:hypothetical protein
MYANDVNTCGGNVGKTNKITEVLLVASKDVGLEMNPEKTKCM